MEQLRYTKADGTIVTAAGSDNAIATLDLPHYMTHAKKRFRVAKAFTAVAKDALVYLRLVTPATAGMEYHLTFSANSGSTAYVYLYEGTTFTAGAGQGTSMTPVCKNRTATLGTTSVLAYHTPTVNALGTALIDTAVFEGATGKDSQNAGVDPRDEWIFGPSAEILIAVANKDASAAKNINITAEWYEVA